MRIFTALFALLALASAASFGQAPKTTSPSVVQPTPALRQLLSAIRAADKGQLAVSEEDGRFLRTLVAVDQRQAGPRDRRGQRLQRHLDRSGASAKPAARLVTIEYDPVRAKEAAANIKAAGLSDIVQVIPGDAFAEIPKLAGTFDVVFLDAWKPDYKKFFDLVFPRVTPGGLFLAHNVINKKSEMGDFLTAIETHPQAVTTIVSAGSEGISMTYRRR